MADTQRDKDAFLNPATGLFRNNTMKEISPQRLRDFTESSHVSHGSFSVTASAATAIAVAGTFVKAGGTTTAVDLHRFTMPQNNRLTYTGSPDVHVHVTGVLSIQRSGGAGGATISIAVAKNGTVVSHSQFDRMLQNVNDVANLGIGADLTMSLNDYIEIFVANQDDTGDLLLPQAYLHANSIFA